ncbi:MAG: hypothetical protein KF866_11290 [Phycisphaeraceae bacterium]|nr:hypothetical protein [Phycisphaeraceae bacterium]MCW5754241.1 hypothetical protein [Phycisphaeraceae bacterium]
MLYPILTTILLIPAVLATLFNAASTKAFAGRPPSGPDAMGVIVLLFAAIIAGCAFVLAAWLCVAAGAFSWLNAPAGVPFALATIVTLGIVFAAACVVIVWMERAKPWIQPVGLIFGIIAPLLLALTLFLLAWSAFPDTHPGRITRFLAAILCLPAFAGYLSAGGLFILFFRQSSANARRTREARIEFEAEWERKRNRAPLEALHEDFAAASLNTPLWWFIASLPDHDDPACRAFIIDRARRVPDFENDLTHTLDSTHPRYRHGCVDLIRFTPIESLRPEWAAPLAAAIERTAAELRDHPTWLQPDYEANPYPDELLRALCAAADLFPQAPEPLRALRTLAQAASTLQHTDLPDDLRARFEKLCSQP